MNIPGNERAKSALSSSITNMNIQDMNLVTCMSRFCLDKWQDIWNCCENSKLYSIYNTVGSVTHCKEFIGHDSIVINRLLIGHSRLTHSYFLSNDDVPVCETSELPLTVKHILV